MPRVFEVNLATGEPLMAFDGLHDLSAVVDVPAAMCGAAACGRIFGARYAP